MKTTFVRKGQPHIQPIGACFSITMLAHDAVPGVVLQQLQVERQAALLAIENEDDYPEEAGKIRRLFE